VVVVGESGRHRDKRTQSICSSACRQHGQQFRHGAGQNLNCAKHYKHAVRQDPPGSSMGLKIVVNDHNVCVCVCVCVSHADTTTFHLMAWFNDVGR